MSGRDDGEARGHAEAWGHASGNGQVYQSRANQYVTHIHIAEARTRTAHEARQRADVVVQVLVRAVGEWAARCQELEEQVRRARAEGRAEAQAEFAEKLKDAELRVMQAQSTVRRAEAERARAEELLTKAQAALARRHRDGEWGQDVSPLRDALGPARDRQDVEQFSELLERAEGELGVVRAELRQLGEEIDGVTPRVVQGESVRQAATVGKPAPAVPVTSPSHKDLSPTRPAPKKTVRPKPRRTPVPGPRRQFLIAVTWLVCALPPLVPMSLATTLRAMDASDAGLWRVLPSAAVTVLAGFLVYAITIRLAWAMTIDVLDRDAEQGAAGAGCMGVSVGSMVLLTAGWLTPLSWPGPAGAWGRGIASLMGLG